MFIKAVNDLHNLLLDNDNMTIRSFVIRKPLEHTKRQKIVDDCALPESLAAFYEEMNGFQISYTFRSNEHFQAEHFGQYENGFPYLWPNENYWNLDGCINILPLDLMLLNDWKNYTWYDIPNDNVIDYEGRKIKETELERSVRPLDVYSKSNIAVLYLNEGKSDVLLGTDHNASYIDFYPIQFDEYLSGCLKNKGLVSERQRLFSKR